MTLATFEREHVFIFFDNYGPGLAVDGAYGPKSRAATLAFQRHRMLAVDGVVDGADWTSLDTALAQLG